MAAIIGINYVQLAMPAGEEDRARGFYTGVLGLVELRRPAALDGRGGLWFAAGPQAVHLGVEPEFRPARKAHPALQVTGLQELIARCEAAGYPAAYDVPLPGISRCHVHDVFGNRIELVERLEHGSA